MRGSGATAVYSAWVEVPIAEPTISVPVVSTNTTNLLKDGTVKLTVTVDNKGDDIEYSLDGGSTWIPNTNSGTTWTGTLKLLCSGTTRILVRAKRGNFRSDNASVDVTVNVSETPVERPFRDRYERKITM